MSPPQRWQTLAPSLPPQPIGSMIDIVPVSWLRSLLSLWLFLSCLQGCLKKGWPPNKYLLKKVLKNVLLYPIYHLRYGFTCLFQFSPQSGGRSCSKEGYAMSCENACDAMIVIGMVTTVLVIVPLQTWLLRPRPTRRPQHWWVKALQARK